jgi:hypothetical protein
VRVAVRLSVLCLFAAVSPLAAQAAVGTVEFTTSVHIPESAGVPVPGGTFVTMQMTAMSDGHRVAMEIVPTVLSSPMSGMLIRMLFTPGSDSIHLGIIFPPEMAAAAGGGSGMRMDGPISMLGGGNPLLAGIMDSVGKAMKDSLAKGGARPTSRSLGTTSTVAGVSCEEWESVMMGDTTRTCVIPTPPGVQAIEDRFKEKSGMEALMGQLPGMAEMAKSAYGGRAMTPIRADNPKTHIHMEFVKYTPGAPDPARMELPAGLRQMPGMPGGGGSLR